MQSKHFCLLTGSKVQKMLTGPTSSDADGGTRCDTHLTLLGATHSSAQSVAIAENTGTGT